jgi:uncharacterized protein (DUF934 family)
MPLVDKGGREIADGWAYPHAEGNIAVGAYAVLPADRVIGLGAGFAPPRPIGVLVTADMPADLIAPMLDQLDLVVVAFAKFRDGRGFTIARALRERHSFAGDIRAIGHVLPDQLAALAQCGFSSIVTPADHPPVQWGRGVATAASGEGRGQLLNRLMAGRAVSAGGISRT